MDNVITYNTNKCVICQRDGKEGTNLVRVGKKGLNAILDYFKRRSNQSLETYLQTYKHATPNVKFFVYVDEISQTRFVLIIMRYLYSHVWFIRLQPLSCKNCESKINRIDL